MHEAREGVQQAGGGTRSARAECNDSLLGKEGETWRGGGGRGGRKRAKEEERNRPRCIVKRARGVVSCSPSSSTSSRSFYFTCSRSNLQARVHSNDVAVAVAGDVNEQSAFGDLPDCTGRGCRGPGYSPFLISPLWRMYVCICTHIVQPADLIRREVQRGLVMQMRKVQSSARARTSAPRPMLCGNASGAASVLSQSYLYVTTGTCSNDSFKALGAMFFGVNLPLVQDELSTHVNGD